MSDNVAILDGFTREVVASNNEMDLYLLVKPDADLGDTFNAMTGQLRTYAALQVEKLLSETDAPYVAPVPYRGKRNEPIYVEEVVKAIAQIRNQDFEIVKEAMVQNAMKAFNI